MKTRRKVNYRTEQARALALGATECPKCEDGWIQYSIQHDINRCPKCDHREDVTEAPEKPPEPPYCPPHWIKGQLLNVRHNGSTYVVTLLEEEFDPYHPERAKFFDNSFDAQMFVSNWYNRQSHDPRAT